MNSIVHLRLGKGVLAGFRTCLVAVVIVLLLAGAPAAFAQSIYANLSGTVTDSTGAVVSGAKVTVTNAGTNVARQFTSNNAGFFSATELPVGTYNVSAEAKGFKKWQGKGIVLNSSDNKTVSIDLQIGTESEVVEVTAAAGEVAVTDTGEKFGLISSEQLQQLSLIGRNAAEFLKIMPGAAQKTNGGTNRPASDGSVIGIGFNVSSNSVLGAVAINGQQGPGLSINQDGQNVEDPGALGGATPVNPNPDMISEVKVLTSNYGADNAKGPVVVNTITKSGGSTFHGAAHFYARNSELNSEDSFNKLAEKLAGQKPGYLKIPSHFYYPGFDIGGPVLIPGTGFNKDRKKFFFHESFEAYRQLLDGGINRAFIPTADMINKGDFSILNTWTNAGGASGTRHDKLGKVPTLGEGGWAGRPQCTITGGVLSPECISSAAQLWMQRSLPAPNLAAPDANGFNYVTPVQQSFNSWQNLVKFDANLSENTKFYVSWSRQREHDIMPLGLWNGSGDWVIPAPSQTLGANTSDLYTVNFLHLFSPTLTVEARFGYTHMDLPGAPQTPKNVLRDQMGFPLKGVFGNPNTPVATSWGSTIPHIGDIGHDYHPTFYAEKGIPSYGGDLTKVFRTHTAKFGGMYEHIYNSQDAWAQYQGVFSTGPWSSSATGNNYADLLMGENSAYFEQAMPPAIKMVQNEATFYATDHWQLTRRITVDYGMRFDHWGAGYPDTKWGAAIFDKSKYVDGVKNSGITWHGLNSSVPLAGAKLDFLVYSPRIGAAIDLFGNGKTVIRGGWGQYRYGNWVVASQSAANTAMGSVGWGAPGTALTWEDVDQFKNDGGGTTGSCAANQTGGVDAGNNHCAPLVVFGVPTDMTNGNIDVVDPHNHDQPYTTTYSLNVNQRLPGKFMFELSYVGNHSEKTQNGVNYNFVPLGSMSPDSVNSVCSDLDGSNPDPTTARMNDGNCQQRYRLYKNYQSLRTNESAGSSQYDSLQTSLTRSAGWATLNFNYTWSKVLGNTNSTAALKDYGIHEYWSPLNYNRAHAFNAAYIFTLPKVRTANRFLNGAANGWEVSGITQIQSGAMLTAASGSYQFNISNAAGGQWALGSPDVTVAPILTCNPKQGLKKNQFVNPNCFELPMNDSKTIGNTRFPYIAGPMYWNSDITLLKKFNITERQKLEFRFAAFNFMNHALKSFSSGDGNLKLNFDGNTGVLQNKDPSPGHTCPGPTCDAFGYANYTYGKRILEFAAKYNF